jgi:hypothetical protein
MTVSPVPSECNAKLRGMAKPFTIHPRIGHEHVFALSVIEAAEGVTTSGAVRWLIERYAQNLRNPQLLDALPSELHDQVPDLLTVARNRETPFDGEADAIWVEAHARAAHPEDVA